MFHRGQGTTGMQSASALSVAFSVTWFFFFFLNLVSFGIGGNRLRKWAIPWKVTGWQQSIYHLPWHPKKIKAERTVVLHNFDIGNWKWDLRTVSEVREHSALETGGFSPKVWLHVCMYLSVCVYILKKIHLCINKYVHVQIKTMSLWRLQVLALW